MHPLWRIHELDVMDKHKLLLPARTNAEFDDRFVAIWLAEGDTPEPYPILPPGTDSKAGHPEIHIVLQYGSTTEPLPRCLQSLLNWTREIVAHFRGEFA